MRFGIEVVVARGGKDTRVYEWPENRRSTIVKRRRGKEVERHELRRGRKRTQGSSWGYCLLVASLAERVAQPFQTLVQTVTGSGAGRLDVLWICVRRRKAE